MTQVATESLVLLLRAALGEMPTSMPPAFDFKSAFALAQQQEVSAIALDGLQKLAAAFPDLLINDASLKAIKLQWIGNMMAQERRYNANFIAAKDLAELYDDNGIRTYVLKGLSIAQLYPVPSHRFSCDLDCFLLSKENMSVAYESGNSIVKAIGCNVDADYYKHSVFAYKGLMVENHRYCCSVKRSKRTRKLENYLESLLNCYAPKNINGTKIALPSQMFQVLFLIEHANGHFLYSKMSIKHICDWAMMRRNFKEALDWKEFDKQCQRFGLKNFVECMNHLADYVLGVCCYQDLTPTEKRVLTDTMSEMHLSSSKMRHRVEKAIGVLQSNWKFKYFCGDSMLKELSHSVWAYLREDNPELD